MNSRMRIDTCSKSVKFKIHLDQQTPEGQRTEAQNIITTKNISLNVNVNLSRQKLRQKFFLKYFLSKNKSCSWLLSSDFGKKKKNLPL